MNVYEIDIADFVDRNGVIVIPTNSPFERKMLLNFFRTTCSCFAISVGLKHLNNCSRMYYIVDRKSLSSTFLFSAINRPKVIMSLDEFMCKFGVDSYKQDFEISDIDIATFFT